MSNTKKEKKANTGKIVVLENHIKNYNQSYDSLSPVLRCSTTPVVRNSKIFKAAIKILKLLSSVNKLLGELKAAIRFVPQNDFFFF